MTSSTDLRVFIEQDGSAHEPVVQDVQTLAVAGQVANEQAAQGVFADYLARKADNTICRQAADLARFATFSTRRGRARACSSARHWLPSRSRSLPSQTVPTPTAKRGVA